MDLSISANAVSSLATMSCCSARVGKGIGIDNFTQYKVNDIIEVYELKEVKRKLL